MDTIEAELSRTLNVKRKKGEDEQVYLARILTASQNAEEETWEALSVPAQRWCNTAAKAYDAKKEIAGFADEDEPAAKGKQPRAAKAAAGVPAPKASKKAAANGAAKPPSMYRTLKGLVMKNPEAPADKLAEGLRAAGFTEFKVSTIQVCRTETRDTIRRLQDMGLLTKQLIA